MACNLTLLEKSFRKSPDSNCSNLAFSIAEITVI